MNDRGKRPPLTRRGLLRTALRGAGLAGLAVLAWRLGGRRRRSRSSACTNRGRCTACRRVNDCRLPAAHYARQIKEGR